MRICHINLARGYRGGERQTELLIRQLAREGLAQRLIARHDSPLLDNLHNTPDLELLAARKPFVRHLSRLRNTDLVHAHETRAAQLAFIARRLGGRPYVVTRRIPNVPRNSGFTRDVYRRAEIVVVLSQAIRQGMQRFLPGLDTEIIPSMIAHLPQDERVTQEIRECHAGLFLVGHAGALVMRHKGQQILIEAARHLRSSHPSMRFLLLGEGRDEIELRRLAQGMDNVQFIGFRHDIGNWLAAMDLFVFPSLQEGLGSTLLDAMDFGLPLIASDVDGIPEIIHNGETGLLTPPGDANALAEAIKQLYQDIELRQRLAAAARRAVTNYEPHVIAARYLALYRRMLSSTSVP